MGGQQKVPWHLRGMSTDVTYSVALHLIYCQPHLSPAVIAMMRLSPCNVFFCPELATGTLKTLEAKALRYGSPGNI